MEMGIRIKQPGFQWDSKDFITVTEINPQNGLDGG